MYSVRRANSTFFISAPSEDPRHLMARPYLQQRSPSKRMNSQYVCPVDQKTLVMAWPCHTHAGWQKSQEHLVWGTGHRPQTQGQYCATKMCVPQCGWHHTSRLQNGGSRLQYLATCHQIVNKSVELKREEQWEERRHDKHVRTEMVLSDDTIFVCKTCSRACRSSQGSGYTATAGAAVLQQNESKVQNSIVFRDKKDTSTKILCLYIR